MKKEYIVKKEDDLDVVVYSIINKLAGAKVILLKGDLGAGKTTFVKHFARALGYKGLVQSPTYSLLNEYPLPNNKLIYHFDLYRLNSLKEAIEIGIEDCLFDSNFCFVEWYDLILELIFDVTIYITITTEGNTRRILFERKEP
jgi:tRNA threonylcarbamoyladenosine biosynthesis protein TsaE